MGAHTQRTNPHRFDEVAPLIAEDAVYWLPTGRSEGWPRFEALSNRPGR
jgi:hypothetical protein